MRVVTLSRKACSEGSATSNALRWATGAIDVDGCRIAGVPPSVPQPDFRHVGGRATHLDAHRRSGQMSNASGRWPANTVLVHEAGCRPDGTTMVPGYVINRHVGGAHPFGDAVGVAYESERLPDERVVKWVCQDGCAVMALDRQSGDRPSTLTGRADPRGPHPHPATATRKRGVVYGDSQGDVALNDPGTRVYADGGGASRFFRQTRRADMKDGIPQELWDYLVTMISPPPSCEPVLIAESDLASVDFAALADKSVHGIVTVGDPSPWMKEIDRVLRPGAHLLLISDEADPTGSTGACAVEDFGYEIRDAIAVLDTPGEFNYVAKASTTERNAGVSEREKTIHSERLFPRADEDVGALRDDLAENVEAALLDAMVEDGLLADDVPDEMRDRFDARTVERKRVVRSDHPCLHPDDLVMTSRGYRPISSMESGDFVYCADGQFHPVEHVSRHRYNSPLLYRISVIGTNYTTTASDNHPFLIWRPLRRGTCIVGGEVLWLEAREIRRGDYTMNPLMADDAMGGLLHDSTPTYDQEFWFLFGLYLAEGVIQVTGHGSNGYPSYTLGAHETDLLERIHAFFHHVNVGVYEKETGDAYQVIPFDPDAGSVFSKLGGRRADRKALNPVLWALPIDMRKAIFEGYMAGDGGDVRSHRQAKTVSRDLASQIYLLADTLGYRTNLHRYEGTPGRIGEREFKSVQPEHQLHFYSGHRDHSSSRPVYIEHAGKRHVLRYVKSVVGIEYEGDVVNLSVVGSPTFLTAVGMSHNTVKPVAIMEALLADVPDGSVVCDPFMGSGTTGIACIKESKRRGPGHDLNFIGIEQDKEYTQIADQRVHHWNKESLANRAAVESEAPPLENEAKVEGGLFDHLDVLGGDG